MRIIAGQWRGRKLLPPVGTATRPTGDRTRETLFSMLASRVGTFEGLRAADIFAGTGALGLEALSRGASHCTFVENDRQAMATLKSNIAQLGAAADVRMGSALAMPPASAPCDLLFLDPPYGSDVIPGTLSELSGKGWIGSASWISVETAHDETFEIQGFTMDTERKIGKARIVLLRPDG